MSLVDRLGARALRTVSEIRAAAFLALSTAATSWEERGRHGGLILRNLLLQVRFTGLDALGLVAVASLALGLITILQSEVLLRSITEPGFVDRTIVFLLVRELPAILVGLILIARSGTAITTEIANMRLNRELESLDAHGVPPAAYVYLPRLIGFPIASVCLTFYFVLIAVAGGLALVPLVHPHPMSVSFDSIRGSIRGADVLLPAAKSAVFGFLTALYCCHSGMSVRKSFREVPQAATRGVTVSFTLCLVANAALTLLALDA